MKEIEVIVKKFEAQDGTRFDDKESCEKHEEECKSINTDCAKRIAMISAKRKRIEEENAEFARKQELKLKELEEKIRSMKHRITSAIKVCEALRRNNFKNELDAKSWAVGYCSTIYTTKYGEGIKMLGVWVNYEPCGTFLFETDGEKIDIPLSVRNNRKDGLYDCIRAYEKFLDGFPKFEENLYKNVDELTK